ncbi:MAG: threonylcarbamoyl-AMP synthase [Flavobacteriaceae bacterium]|nr:threonylcarbamoyl-AMP synthase [Flavobacteriaceae bacterium]
MSIGTNIGIAAKLLMDGETVGIATETVYGLAANALNEDAVLQIFKIKNRPTFNPLIVHVHSVLEMEKFVTHIPESARKLLQAFSPGPLTLVLPKKEIVPDLVTSGHPTVAIRIPAHPLLLELLKQLPFPLAAPSANPFGYISPTTAQHVHDQLGADVPYILDGGECAVGVESTIVSFAEEDTPEVLRYGGITLEQLNEVIPISSKQWSIDIESQIIAPGMTPNHYSPNTPLYLGNVDELMRNFVEKETAILCFCKKNKNWPKAKQVILAQSGTLEEAAKNLFSTLRAMDKAGYRQIIASKVIELGLGRAINDRLQRASVNIC